MADSRADHTVVLNVSPGEILDERWELELRIGQGAMGSVFRGRDRVEKSAVAIKILAPEHCRKPKVLARFEREAELMTTLRHANIVRIFGHGRRGALPYIVMEYLEGHTLAEMQARRGGKVLMPDTLALVEQVAAGLTFLHQHGLVHRDVKPQNVFLRSDGRVTILDLGVVRDQSKRGLTKPGAMVGTPYYMSPEQILGSEDVDLRTDVYALAAMTFELLTGRPPFLGESNFEVLYGHKHHPVPDASALSRGISRTVARVLQRGLSKDRADRQASADQFSQELQQAAGIKPARLRGSKEKTTSPLGANIPTRVLPHRRRTTSAEVPFASPGDVVSLQNLPPVGERRHPTGETAELDMRKELARETRDDDEAGDSGETTDPRKLDPESLFEPASENPTEAMLIPGDPAMLGTLRVMVLVRGRPAAAEVSIDGFPQGTAPRSLPVPEGRHTVQVTFKGHKPVERTVELKREETRTLSIELEPA